MRKWGWRTLQDDKPHDMYFSLFITRVTKSRIMRRALRSAHVGRGTGDKVLVGKHEEKKQFERPRHKWENDIKMDMK
jgi:hypothetical protein